MTANLQVVVAKREGVLKVPNTALRFHPTGQVVENEQKLAARAETARPAPTSREFPAGYSCSTLRGSQRWSNYGSASPTVE